ncbi:MAG: hypothetical protein LBJ11_10680 [Oscillospiraceae bacterium]|jgi:hypothetical protein|nr:hypothetical protein [Oscillospiraceae bacterium]
MHRYMETLLTPLFGVVDSLAADPVGTLLAKLPNPAYHFDKIDALFDLELTLPGGSTMKVFEEIDLGDGIDLSQGIQALLDGLIADATADLGLSLPALPWDKIAHAGDLNTAGQVVADQSVLYGVLVTYIGQIVSDNGDAVGTMLKDTGVPGWLVPVVNWLIKILLWLLLI